jgi:hypothetical protein
MVLQNILRNLWNGRSALESGGTHAYTLEQNYSILLHHKFGPVWFILGCLCGKTRKSKDNLEEYIDQAMIPSNFPRTQLSAAKGGSSW